MSCYTDDNGTAESLYGDVAKPAPAPAAPAPVAPDASAAVGEALALVANPAILIAEALPSAGSSIPFGLAVLGACLVGILWAGSVDKGN